MAASDIELSFTPLIPAKAEILSHDLSVTEQDPGLRRDERQEI